MEKKYDQISLTHRLKRVSKSNRDEHFNFTHYLDLNCSLNGVPIFGFIDPNIIVENLKDNRWVADDGEVYSEFYVPFCSCGVGGCAGFHFGIFVDVVGDEVIWTVPIEEEAYSKIKAFNKKVFVFKKDEYVRALSILPQIKESIRKKRTSLKNVSAYSDISLEDVVREFESVRKEINKFINQLSEKNKIGELS